MARGKRPDTKTFPHVYIGPPSPWGLRTGLCCRILSHRAGGLKIRAEGLRGTYVVAVSHVKAR